MSEAVTCGPCGDVLREDVQTIIGHAETCEKRDPWAAFFRAPNKEEARRILIAYCGLKAPPPMTEETKAMLKARNADPAAQAVRKAKRRKVLAIREAMSKMTKALIRKRGS